MNIFRRNAQAMSPRQGYRYVIRVGPDHPNFRRLCIALRLRKPLRRVTGFTSQSGILRTLVRPVRSLA